MKILALIPARGGSKRLPRKNIRVLGGKPLIVWSIEVAKVIPEICDILVSTDDPEIATVCTEAGASVPWLRPAELATDTASSIDVVLHAMDWYEKEHGKVDGLILLQPTSPFRKLETTHAAVREFISRKLKSLVTVSLASPPPSWCLYEENGEVVPLLGWGELQRRSQDLKPYYTPNGVIYISTPESLRICKSFLTKNTRLLSIEDPFETLDIDTPSDWMMAEFLLQQILVNKDSQEL